MALEPETDLGCELETSSQCPREDLRSGIRLGSHISTIADSAPTPLFIVNQSSKHCSLIARRAGHVCSQHHIYIWAWLPHSIPNPIALPSSHLYTPLSMSTSLGDSRLRENSKWTPEEDAVLIEAVTNCESFNRPVHRPSC